MTVVSPRSSELPPAMVMPLSTRSAASSGSASSSVRVTASMICVQGSWSASRISAVVTTAEIREALQEPCTQIVEAVTRTLELAEPELAADLVDNGITMAGGSSMLRGLCTVISNATGLDVRLAEDPLTCVARGTAVYLENLELWKDTMESDRDGM